MWLIAAALPGGLVALGAYYLVTKCWHKYTRPFTIKGTTYVVCIDCAKEFAYDKSKMKVGKELPNDWYHTQRSSTGVDGLDRSMAQAERLAREADFDSREVAAETDSDTGPPVEKVVWEPKQAG